MQIIANTCFKQNILLNDLELCISEIGLFNNSFQICAFMYISLLMAFFKYLYSALKVSDVYGSGDGFNINP